MLSPLKQAIELFLTKERRYMDYVHLIKMFLQYKIKETLSELLHWGWRKLETTSIETISFVP